ncbi:type II secretion system protein GspC [Bdellovibrionota bacterium FG-1]
MTDSPTEDPQIPNWREKLREKLKGRLGPVHTTLTHQLKRLGPKVREWSKKISQKDGARELLAKIQHFEPMQAVEWANKTFQRQDAGSYGKGAALAICAWFAADLMALLAGHFVPAPPVSRLSRINTPSHRMKTVDDYTVIFTRNLFNHEGKIPGEEGPTTGFQMDLGGTPVRTSLPFNLIGTLILKDELRSIATIEDKSVAIVYPVRIEDEIPSKIRIVKIEPRKVTFMNIASRRREFVDLPEEAHTAGPRIQVGGGSTRASGVTIEKVSPTQYSVSRSEVDKALADFNTVLTQARAVPNTENGIANGYKLFQIVPGSIYDKLGLQNGDVITGIGGSPINDPAKAFEMLNELKNGMSHLELQIKKDGRTVNNVYDIH